MRAFARRAFQEERILKSLPLPALSGCLIAGAAVTALHLPAASLTRCSAGEGGSNFSTWAYWSQCRTSCRTTKLAVIHEAAERLLSRMPATSYEAYDVPVQLDVEQTCFPVSAEAEYTIRTVRVGAEHGDKLPIVLVHGFMMGSATFFKWLPLLATERTIYALDVIGMAGSGRPPFDASKLSAEEAEELLVAAFERWAEKVELTEFALIGHSFGGYVCSAWAARYPARIKFLGLLSPLLGFSDERIARLEPKEDAPWQQRALKCVLDGVWAHHITPQLLVRWLPGAKGWFARASERRFQQMAADVTEEEGRLLSEYIIATMDTPLSTERAPLVCFGPLLRPIEIAGGTIKKRLSQLLVPICIIYGQHDWMDRALPFEIPSCDFIELPFSGHHLYLDNPAGLTAELLARIPGA